MTKDNINPNHYKAGGIETIDLIQDVVKDFGSVCQANILKYGIRANKKHDEPQDDIKKIIRYCEFWLNDLEGLKASGKRSEEIAVFDKLNSLLTPQEERLINRIRNIQALKVEGICNISRAIADLARIGKNPFENERFRELIEKQELTIEEIKELIDILGDLAYGE